MNKTPYALEFLWHQIDFAILNIKKPKYKLLLQNTLTEDIKNLLEKKKDKTGRNYEGGVLERTASLSSLAICMYDNYPVIDIDLLLTSIILSGVCQLYHKKDCFNILKDYPEIIPFLFKKQRTKPSVEIFIYDNLVKLDREIFIRTRQKKS